MPLNKLLAELRPTARERIANGQLPRQAPLRMWGGRGSGEFCDLCDQPIQRDEVEYEVEANMDHSVLTLRFHIVCQSAWQLECAGDNLNKHPVGRIPAEAAITRTKGRAERG
jgi:hypothetical protein